MEVQNKINIFINEYKKLVEELNQKRQELDIENSKYEKLSNKLNTAQNEIDLLNKKIHNINIQIKEDEETFIENKADQLLKKMMTTTVVISLSLAVITTSIQGILLTNILKLIYMGIIYLAIGTATTNVIYAIFRKKYINVQKEKYKESSSYLKKKKELDNTKKFIDEKLNKWNNSSEYEEYNKVLITLQTLKASIISLEGQMENLKITVFNEIILNNTTTNQEETLVLEETEDKQKSLTKTKRRIN